MLEQITLTCAAQKARFYSAVNNKFSASGAWLYLAPFPQRWGGTKYSSRGDASPIGPRATGDSRQACHQDEKPALNH